MYPDNVYNEAETCKLIFYDVTEPSASGRPVYRAITIVLRHTAVGLVAKYWI